MPSSKGTGGYYEVERILECKGPPKTRRFLIKWKGYPDSDNTWEPESNLSNALKEKYFRMLANGESIMEIASDSSSPKTKKQTPKKAVARGHTKISKGAESTDTSPVNRRSRRQISVALAPETPRPKRSHNGDDQRPLRKRVATESSRVGKAVKQSPQAILLPDQLPKSKPYGKQQGRRSPARSSGALPLPMPKAVATSTTPHPDPTDRGLDSTARMRATIRATLSWFRRATARAATSSH